MNFENIFLEPEQIDLFTILTEAQKKLPRQEQQDFVFNLAWTKRTSAIPRSEVFKIIERGESVSFEGRLFTRKEDVPREYDSDITSHPGLQNGTIDSPQVDIDALKLQGLIHFRDQIHFNI